MRRWTVAGGQSRVTRWLHLHERLEPALPPGQLAEQVAVGQGYRGLRRERGGQVPRRLRVGQGVALDGLAGGERAAALALAVDQLEHADDVPARRLHRKHQHGLGAVAGEGVDLRVEAVGALGGQGVGVVDVQDLAGEGHVPARLSGLIGRATDLNSTGTLSLWASSNRSRREPSEEDSTR